MHPPREPSLTKVLATFYAEPFRVLPLVGNRPWKTFSGYEALRKAYPRLDEAERVVKHTYTVLNAYDPRVFAREAPFTTPYTRGDPRDLHALRTGGLSLLTRSPRKDLESLLYAFEVDRYAFTSLPQVRKLFLYPLAVVTGGFTGMIMHEHGVLTGLAYGGMLTLFSLGAFTREKRRVEAREEALRVGIPSALRRLAWNIISSVEQGEE